MFLASHSSFFPGPEGDIAQVVGLRERASVAKVASGRFTSFAGSHPLGMMADRVRNGLGRPLEVLELVLREQQVFPVVREQHSLLANEEDSAAPLGKAGLLQDLGLLHPLIPGQGQRTTIPPPGVLVTRPHGGGSDFGMGRRASGFDRFGGVEVEGPEGQVVPVTAQVGHGPVPKVPPAVPLRSREIDRVIGAHRSRPDPEVPIQVRGDRLGFPGSFLGAHNITKLLGIFPALPSPGPAHPDVHLGNRTNRSGLHQLDHPAIVVAGVNLGALLGGYSGCGRGFGHHPRLVHIARERLFAVDVLLVAQGGKGGKRRACVRWCSPPPRRRCRACRRTSGSRGTWPHQDTSWRHPPDCDHSHRTAPRCFPYCQFAACCGRRDRRNQ